MKNLLPLLFLLALGAGAFAAEAVGPTDSKDGATPASARVGPPADIDELVRLEAERGAIRRALIADLKAAEQQAVAATKTQGREAAATIRAASIRKQQEQSARLRQIEARLQALRPDATTTEPARTARAAR